MSLKFFLYLILFFALLGAFDAGLLTYEHYANVLPPCSLHLQLVDCGAVLRSKYATILGVPVAAIGLVHYTVIFLLTTLAIFKKPTPWIYFLSLQTIIGVLTSTYFVYLQLFIIGNFCLYCLASAGDSLILFILAGLALKESLS